MRNKSFVFVCFLLLSNLGFAATAAQTLKRLLNNTTTMQANFTQQNYGGNKRVIRKLSGNMAIKKPGKFRWDIQSPSQMSMISNGRYLWIYDKNLKQVTVEQVKPNQGSSPAMVLSNRIRLLGNYFIVWKKDGWFYLNPRYKNDQLKQVQLKFSNNRIQQMWVLDKLGQRSHLRFSNVRVNGSLSNSKFNFKAPKGVDVIRS